MEWDWWCCGCLIDGFVMICQQRFLGLGLYVCCGWCDYYCCVVGFGVGGRSVVAVGIFVVVACLLVLC